MRALEVYTPETSIKDERDIIVTIARHAQHRRFLRIIDCERIGRRSTVNQEGLGNLIHLILVIENSTVLLASSPLCINFEALDVELVSTTGTIVRSDVAPGIPHILCQAKEARLRGEIYCINLHILT